ncbi:MAG: DNA cytosine methyltransferase [Mobiluncus sp.]|uniref:Class I SAM-dependent methyltransferase n=1 Tax=Mobiluncus porci TaxID=2652278 RepID=A0A7K0K5I0_9ACTO|nr:class I SAM-dependent methyltransferase [Mobiluncus sp.]MCI6584030.1 DNA cytosine methyltransferase [Mobiluncus sp.]MST50696.1 class I SAM-dependent methyltransferase [Mobiluncus porci]
MDNNALKPVLEPKGFRLLNELGSLGPYSRELGEKLNAGLRSREVAPELVAAVLTQLQLREEAKPKFGEFAAGMLFTRKGLEQATRLVVAATHAARFRHAGCHKVADLGCGLGAESLAFAGVGLLVEAFEIDEATAAAALMNLRAFPEAHVTQADVTALNWADLRASGVDGAFADPARRDERGRNLQPEQWQPPLSAILALREEIPNRNLGVKVAPGIAHESLPADCESEWVSVDGDLVEAGLWFGTLRESPGRTALLLEKDGHVRANLRDPEDSGDPATVARPAKIIPDETALGAWLFEPDAAIIRAGLVAHVAQLTETASVSTGIAYLTGDGPSEDTRKLGAWFEIEKILPFDDKVLRTEFKARGVRSLEIKKRGAEVSPATLRKRLLPKADPQGEDLVLIVTRLAGRHRTILARRG